MKASTSFSTQRGDPFSPAEIEQGRVHAVLSYIVPGFLILTLRRSPNAFARFHARQALTLWLAALATALALSMFLVFLTVLLMAIPISVTIGLLTGLVFLAGAAVAFVGVRNAWNGSRDVLPGVGRFGETHMSLWVKD